MGSLAPCYVFDLDGVLFDTREAVRLAYLAAGVKMPKDAWGKPWRDWLPKELGEDPDLEDLIESNAVHWMKNFVYPAYVRHAYPLSGLAAAYTARETGAEVHILTGASRHAVNALRNEWGHVYWIPPVLMYECTPTMKIRCLADHDPKGVYVDDADWSPAGRYASQFPGWKFVRYYPTMTVKEILWTP